MKEQNNTEPEEKTSFVGSSTSGSTKETLSSKIKIEDINVGLSGELSHAFVLVTDVKQFIKDLKEIDMGEFILINGLFSEEMYWEEIDKLAGDKLV